MNFLVEYKVGKTFKVDENYVAETVDDVRRHFGDNLLHVSRSRPASTLRTKLVYGGFVVSRPRQDY